METATQPENSVHFESFELKLRTRELYRNGIRLKIRGHPVDVLAILLENPGELVTREELKKRLWPADTFVDFEQILNNSVVKLRDALGDSAESPRFIETLPRLGYRFVASIENGETNVRNTVQTLAEISHEPPADSYPQGHRIPVLWFLWLAVPFVCALVFFGFRFLRTPLAAPEVTHYEQLTLDGRVKYVRGTDGLRIYVESRRRIYQLPVSGGTLSEVPFDFPAESGGPLSTLWDMSPDGSKMLVGNQFLRFEGAKLWVVGALGQRARYLARAITAAWSPDSKTVVYITLHGDVYTIGIENGGPRLLLRIDSPATQTVFSDSVSWSPDGKTIRFTRYGKSAIWEMTSEGGNLHEFLPGWNNRMKKCCGRWTPDGDFYLFLAGRDLDRYSFSQSLAQIWAVDERRRKLHPANSEPVLLASSPLQWGPPLPSRDGKKIFAQGVSLRGELGRYNERSNRFEPYLNGISADMPAFSRDGKYVAYVSFPEGILWRANRDGSTPLQLTQPPFYPRKPRWSPDGTNILFTDKTQTGVDRIYLVSTQGGEPRRVLPKVDEPQSLGDWSPDGSKIVYSTHPGFSDMPFDTNKIDTRIYNLTTGNTSTLPRRPEGFWSPMWSPDGRYIAGQRIGSNSILVFDLRTQSWKTFDFKVPIGYHYWSHDGKYIYFWLTDRTKFGIYRISLKGGKEEAVVTGSAVDEFHLTGWTGAWMSLDPEDVPLLFRDVGTNEIYALTLERK